MSHEHVVLELTDEEAKELKAYVQSGCQTKRKKYVENQQVWSSVNIQDSSVLPRETYYITDLYTPKKVKTC